MLKPAGFTKKSATFSRSHTTHIELFNIQSSQWNGPLESSFYVNCGLVFSDIPIQYPWMYFSGAQWACRIEELQLTVPSDWGYTGTTINSVMEKLGTQIFLASAEFSSNLNEYKQRYVRRIEDLYG